MTRAIVTFLWRGQRGYGPGHANALARMCKRYSPNLRVICVAEDMDASGFCDSLEIVEMPPAARALGKIQTPEGSRFPSSYRRLWALSSEATVLADQILLLDVDCIIVGALDSYFDRTERFVGWRPKFQWGTTGRFGGGTWLHRTGTLAEQYEWFARAPERAILQAKTAGYRGSDQAILSFLFSKTEASFAEPTGIYQAQDYTRQGGDYAPWSVPRDARILHFNGTIKPWHSRAAFAQQLYQPFVDAAHA